MSAQDKILKDKTDIIRLKDLSCDEVCSFIETVKKNTATQMMLYYLGKLKTYMEITVRFKFLKVLIFCCAKFMCTHHYKAQIYALLKNVNMFAGAVFTRTMFHCFCPSESSNPLSLQNNNKKPAHQRRFMVASVCV